MVDQKVSGAGKAFAYGTGAGDRSHLAKLRDGARHCNSALSLPFLLRILSGAAKAPWRPAPERIRSKNERLSAQSFTRRYEMVRDTVTDRAPRAFKEHALGSRRAERASEHRKGRPQRASKPNTKPGGVCVVCALRFVLCTTRIFKEILWGHPSSLVVLHLTWEHGRRFISCRILGLLFICQLDFAILQTR